MPEDQKEGSSSGTGPQAGSADPAAVALAMGGVRRERADSFLNKQEALSDIEIARLKGQDPQFHGKTY